MNAIALAAVRAGVINPSPSQPPGTNGLVTLVNYILWICLAIVSVFLIIGITQIAASWRHGGEIEGVKRTVLSAVALTVLGSIGLVLSAL
ncbi:MAG TPA: hypothetical protein VFP72_03955 [Kineosporiaceae bacterium]|nr:hypothetical protein [Kineosporiaceae bacterium]